jgi:predicted 3-demethylubiquinone-9 3-methyltransferase (glyoxalase superfamily)
LLLNSQQQSRKAFVGDNAYGVLSVIDFTLGGVPYQFLDARSMFALSEAVSIALATDEQAETDRLGAAFTSNGGDDEAEKD